MRSMLALLAVLGLGAGRGRAADAPALRISRPSAGAAIVATVEAQLAALRAGDWAGAYRLAAERFRARVPAARFAAMITGGYPIMLRGTRAELAPPRDDGEKAVVAGRVFAKDGASEPFEWVLLREPAGWRIAGIVPQQPKAGL